MSRCFDLGELIRDNDQANEEFSNALKIIEVESVGTLKIIKDKQEQDKPSVIKTCDHNINHFLSSLFPQSAPQCVPTFLLETFHMLHVQGLEHVSDGISALRSLQMNDNAYCQQRGY